MRRALLVSLALLASASAAYAGGSKLIRNGPKPERPRVHIPVASDAPNGHALGASPALYVTPGTLLGRAPSLEADASITALRAAAGAEARFIFDSQSGHIVRALDMEMQAPVPGSPEASAVAFLAAYYEAFGLTSPPDEGSLSEPVDGPFGELHVAVEQRAPDGHPIYGAIVTLHLDGDGAPYMIQSEAIPHPALFRPKLPVAEAAARSAAGSTKTLKPVSSRLVYYRTEGASVHRLAWQVDIGADRTFVDAETGGVMERVDRRSYRDQTANAWDPNPLDGGVGPAESDPQDNLGDVTLTDLNTSGLLDGAICTVIDLQNSEAFDDQNDADNDFFGLDGGNAAQAEFIEQISVYHYIVTTANLIHDLSGGAIDIDTLEDHYEFGVFLDIDTPDNAFFDPSDRTLQFGDGVVDEIENLERDIDVAAHEFGHFVESTYAPDQAPRVNSQRRAMGEAFGDFTAAAVNGALGGRGGQAGALCIGDSTIPLGSNQFDCLREYSLTSIKRTPQNLHGEEHDDGEIVAGAFYSLAALLESNTTTDFTEFDEDSLHDAYRILLAGLQHLPRSNAQFSDLVDALVAGDKRRTGNANKSKITAAFARHGMVGSAAPPSESTKKVTPRELLLGIFTTDSYDRGQLRRFFVRVPSPGTDPLFVLQVRVDGDDPTTGDSRLFVAPNNYDEDTDKVVSSIDDGADRNTQLVQVSATATLGFDAGGNEVHTADCRIGDDAFWLIDVIADRAGTYTVHARDPFRDAVNAQELSYNGSGIAGEIPDSNKSETDIYFFDSGEAGDIARVRVVGQLGANIRPTVWLFDSSLNLLSADIDGSDEAGNPTGTAIIEGHPLPEDGNYVIVVTSFAPNNATPTTFGLYDVFADDNGTLPGDPIVLNLATSPTSTAVSGTVETGEDILFNLTINSTVKNLRIRLTADNTTTTSDIDLLVATQIGADVEAGAISNGRSATEQVRINSNTDLSIRDSNFYFVIVRGFDVQALRSRTVNPTEAFTLEVFANEKSSGSSSGGGGGGGGGCALAPERAAGEGLAGLWLPLALASLAIVGLSKRRGRRRSGAAPAA